MPAFRFVCPPHRQRFIELVEGEGCRDLAAMEQVRRLLLVWLAERYPRLVLDSFNSESCMGCALDAACIDLTDMCAVIRQASRAARSLAGDSGCSSVARSAIAGERQRLREQPRELAPCKKGLPAGA